MNKQLTHLEAGCGYGQLWQEELPLGWEGQAGQCDAELGVHFGTCIHTGFMKALPSDMSLGPEDTCGSEWAADDSPGLSSQGLLRLPRGCSYGEQVERASPGHCREKDSPPSVWTISISVDLTNDRWKI